MKNGKKQLREKPVVLSQMQYKEIISQLQEIQKRIAAKSLSELIDNSDFIIMMKISRRLAQEWRSNGVIGYSKIGGKIFYKPEDILQLIEKHYTAPATHFP